MWWIHLLVRKVDDLFHRNMVLERVTRAFGPFPYAERTDPVMLQWLWGEDPVHELEYAMAHTLYGPVEITVYDDDYTVLHPSSGGGLGRYSPEVIRAAIRTAPAFIRRDFYTS